MLRIGLTGGIATGKSTVAAILVNDFHVPVVDADQIARDIVQPNQPALQEIVATFGPEMLSADGQLNRELLGHCVMNNPDKRLLLESITHPRIFLGIRDALTAHENSGEKAAIVEAALMVETGSYRAYDKLIVVSSSQKLQLQRLCARDGHDSATALKWIESQLPLLEKEAVADVVIRNDGDHADLVRTVHREWCALMENASQ